MKTTHDKPILPKDYKDWIRQGDAHKKEKKDPPKLKDIKGPKK
jgi:hypothetical protein